MERIPIVSVVGPTASGKTALAVELAIRLGGEVISADSMQIYRGMDIATAKPTAAEMRGVPHHLIDCIDPREGFSVARYCDMARPIIDEIRGRGRLPILCGGTGLYIDSLLGNMQFCEYETDPAIRTDLQRAYEERGVEYLLNVLRGFDPASADRLSQGRNPKRIIRAIEVYRASGMTQTQLNERQTAASSPYRAIKLGLTANDRQVLYERINRRVDRMMEDGLLEEAKCFYQSEQGDTAAAAIGYKELLPYLVGESDLDTCIESLKRATRRYAKRQLTWFGRDVQIHWFCIDEIPFDEIADRAESIIKEHLYE
jgi:tRNA dimethylallyltransferase